MATGSFYSYFGSKAEIFAAVVRRINTDLRHAIKAALEHTDGGQRAKERASFRVYFDMLSKRPWMDRIVRESEFIDPRLFREYYEHLTRGYARGVRAAQLAREVDAQYDPEVIAFAYTGIGNFVGMRWAEWTAGGRVPEDVLDDVLELLARGLRPAVPGKEASLENPRLWTTLWTSWGRCCVLLGKQVAWHVDYLGNEGTAAGGRSAASAGTHFSGCGPSAASSASCMAHHGDTGCRPVRASVRNRSQSTHLTSATSAGSGSGTSPEYAAYTGQTSFSVTPFAIRAW
jgi:AcrR family transcriptional regulator